MSPSVSYDTTIPSMMQAEHLEVDGWQTHIIPQFPEGWQEQAFALNAMKRERKLRCPADLLRGLLAYVLCVRSFRHLGLWSLLLGLADLSEAAWRKRMRNAGPWLWWLFRERLALSTPLSGWVTTLGWRRILLIDATHFKLAGKTGLIWRLHTAFDLLAGRLTDLRLTTHRVAEDLRLLEVEAGDLLIADSGYGYRNRISHLLSCGADGLLRFTPSGLPLYEQDGKHLDVVRWLKGRRAPAGRIVSRGVWLDKEPCAAPALRMVALRLTEEQRARAQKRKRAKACRDKRAVQAETLYLAGWVLLITTIPAERASDAQVLQLYRSRWQIELLFKRMKQILGSEQIRCRSQESASANISAFLLCWALQEEEAAPIRRVVEELGSALHAQDRPADLAHEEPGGPLSLWRLSLVCTDVLRQQVRGAPVSRERLHTMLPACQRFLRDSPRRRTHWYTTQCQQFGSPGLQESLP